MRALIFLGLVVATGCGVSRTAEEREARIGVKREAIVGGHVTWGFPQIFNLYMEMIDGSAGTCSATLVGRRTLLTSAHCIRSDDKRTSATFVDAHNETVRRNVADEDFIVATQWSANPQWQRVTEDDESDVDIALVRLEKEPFVRPIPWNTDPLDLSWRTRVVTATGYGVEEFMGSGSGTKCTIDIPIVSVADATIITGTMVPLTGTCFGDSGGGILTRFADGPRVISVNSKLRIGACGPGTSTRTDANEAWLRPRFLEYDAPTCAADNECVTVGCTTPDPDCACVADGQCATSCVAPTVDPDCAGSCAADGVCSTTACGSPDPDCAPLGDACGRDAHCASRLCRDSEQHPEPYCTQACSATSPCPGGLECAAGVCRRPVLPTAGLGEVCVVNGTRCEGTEAVCTRITARGPEPRCFQRCLESDDCDGASMCVVDESGQKACGNVVKVPNGTTVELPAGCSSGVGVLAWLAVLLFRRSRR